MGATNGQNGKNGSSCFKANCFVEGGRGGSNNVANLHSSFNDNGGDGGSIPLTGCNIEPCFAQGGNGGIDNSHNSDNSHNGNGGAGGSLGGSDCPSGCSVKGG